MCVLPVGQPRSFEPLPKPRDTQPERLIGNKVESGPSRGPQIDGRDKEGSCCMGLGRVVILESRASERKERESDSELGVG